MAHRSKLGAGVAMVSVAILLLGMAAVANADVLVVGNKGEGVSKLSAEEVEGLYLGKTVHLPDGTRAEVVDLPSGNPVRDEFYSKVIGKDPDQIKAYWAKRIFTGKGSPPDTKPTEDAVVEWVAQSPGRIGYVSGKTNTGPVKVLLKQD